jgi:Mg-chelatase subunit ChlI
LVFYPLDDAKKKLEEALQKRLERKKQRRETTKESIKEKPESSDSEKSEEELQPPKGEKKKTSSANGGNSLNTELENWKKRNNLSSKTMVYVCQGSYSDIRAALEERGV